MAKLMDLTADTSVLLADLFSKRTKRLPLEHEAKLLEEQEKSIQQELIKRKLPSGTYAGYSVEVKTTEEPFGMEWDKIVQYIKDTGQVDLLEKRLLKSGVKKRWEDGISIPGVVKVEKTAIKVEKL